MKFYSNKTNRGFSILHFYDDNDELCDIQRSSSADIDRIWFGNHSASPKILASKTKEGGTGWVDYYVPDDVLMSTRMHLTRKQSISLAFRLLKFGLINRI